MNFVKLKNILDKGVLSLNILLKRSTCYPDSTISGKNYWLSFETSGLSTSFIRLDDIEQVIQFLCQKSIICNKGLIIPTFHHPWVSRGLNVGFI